MVQPALGVRRASIVSVLALQELDSTQSAVVFGAGSKTRPRNDRWHVRSCSLSRWTSRSSSSRYSASMTPRT